MLWNDKVAAAHTVFYLVSAAIFLPLVAGMFLFMKDTTDAPPDPARGLDSRARAVLHQLNSHPGLEAGGSTYWESFGNNLVISEVGLRDEESAMLSYGKIDNLQRGGLVANPNDPWINYPEFRDSLNLGDNINFHIRMSPVILNPSSDPFGTKPLKGMHVAYVAALGDNGLGTGNYMVDHQFPSLSAQAENEIEALNLLGLQVNANDPNDGFDGKFYQPLNLNPDLYKKLVPLEPGYTNSAVQEGDIIADTSRNYGNQVTGGEIKSYHEWFWSDYFRKAGTTEARYDAIVFGGGVDLTRWLTSASVAQLKTYVEQGGVLVFMGGSDQADGFILGCDPGDANCLFEDTGTQQAPTTPDDTNQMLFVPNKLSHTQYDKFAGKFWNVCNYLPAPDGLGGGVDERLGFIPIDTNLPIGDPCVETYFGATSADRFGATGGTIILTQWDSSWATTAEDTKEVARMFTNLLSYGLLRPVYLDYGPEIPADAPVVTAERLNIVQFPNGSHRDVKLWIYMWRGACGGEGLGCS